MLDALAFPHLASKHYIGGGKLIGALLKLPALLLERRHELLEGAVQRANLECRR